MTLSKHRVGFLFFWRGLGQTCRLNCYQCLSEIPWSLHISMWSAHGIWSPLHIVQITLGSLRRKTFPSLRNMSRRWYPLVVFPLLVWIWALQTGQQIEWMTQQPSLKNCSPHRKRKSFNHTWIHWTANLSHCRAQFHSRWWWNVGQLLEQIGCVVLLRLNVFLLIKI